MTASVTRLFHSLRGGNEDAAHGLIEHFLPQLRKRLVGYASKLRMSDEDDIAIAAFYELCQAIEKSRFDDISDRTQLWQVLSVIAMRKANDFCKHESAIKRGGNATLISIDRINHLVPNDRSDPELLFELQEMCETFLENLKDSDLHHVATLKMKGWSNAEISEEMGVAIRTIQLMVARLKEQLQGLQNIN